MMQTLFYGLSDFTALQKECMDLYRNEAYQSVEILAPMTNHPHFTAAMRAAALYQQGLYPAAKHLYEQCLVYNSHYKINMAFCLEKMGSPVEAVALLQQVSNPEWHVLLRMGEMMLKNGQKEYAKQAFVQVLQKKPYALQAAQHLAYLVSDKKELLQYAQPYSNHYLAAVAAQAKFQTSTALDHWQALLQQYPSHTTAQLQRASLSTPDQARQLYAAVRKAEPYGHVGMDDYALLLSRAGERAALGRLAQDLLQAADTQPQAWNALALYWESKDLTKALEFVEKAVALDRGHMLSFQIKGAMLLADVSLPEYAYSISHHSIQDRPEHASNEFFLANQIQPSLTNFEGMVDSFMAADRGREAISTAKEAISLAPRDYRAITLVGMALSTDGKGLDKATKTLKRALAMNPTALRPLFALVDILLPDHAQEALQVLETALEKVPPGEQAHILVRMGEAYTGMTKYAQAMEHYHKALGLQPDLQEAQQSMERLEKLVHGGMDEDVEEDGASQ